MTILLILNPNSRHYTYKALQSIRKRVEKAGHVISFIETEWDSEAESVTVPLPALRPNAIWVAGGDGTLNDVVSAVIQQKWHDIPIGIIPWGSANVVSHELNLLRNAVKKLIKRLENGKIKKMDVGYINGKPFILCIGSGIDSVAVSTVNYRLKRWIGRQAYAVRTLQLLFQTNLFKTVLIRDSKGKAHTGNWAIISNTRYYGGPFKLTTEGSVFDGKVDVLILTIGSFWRGLRALMDFHLNRLTKMPGVTYFQDTSVTLETDNPIQLDGDIMNVSQNKYEITIKPKLISVFYSD
ncbi:hypothetical protein HOH87_01405 [bacterium]|nr:hypothetical protein [bacterium]